MARQGEAPGQQGLQIAGASLDIESAAADLAVEVVMVLEIRGFVECGLARQFDFDNLAPVEQCVDVSVHGGERH